MLTKLFYETPVSKEVQFGSFIICASAGVTIPYVIENDGAWDDESI